MGYISEDYCSEELSGMLMEKGYIGATNTYLGEDDINVEQITIQSAMKWLREVHGIDISIDIRFWTEDEDVYVKSWKYTVYHTDEIEDFGQSDTYEEACEAAIKYCLENLI